MSNASMSFGRPTRLVVPRSSLWLGSLAVLLIQQLRALDGWLLSTRQQAPKNAEEVMAWASRIEATEPGFAADLRTAALRAQDKDSA